MKKYSLVNIALTILIAITLLGGLSFALINYMVNQAVSGQTQPQDKKMTEPTAKDLEKLTVPIEEIMTNLASDNIVQISFTLQANTKKSAEELIEREFQVNDLIISLLHRTTKEELQGEGLEQFKTMIMNEINTILHEGRVDKVYITSVMLQ